MSESLMESVHRIAGELFGKVDQIAADPLASERAKTVRVARQYRSARQEIDRLRTQLHAGRDDNRQALRRTVLDPTSALPFTASTSDKLLATGSFRDAQHLLRGLSRDDIFGQLEQWATTGDDIGVRACLAEGFRRRDPDMVNACTRAVPEWEADADALWAATVNDRSDELVAEMKEGLATSIPVPQILGGLSDAQIDALSDDTAVPA